MGRKSIAFVAIATLVACGEVALTVDGGPDAAFVDAGDACVGPFCGFDASACDELACQVATCDGSVTSVSGRVFDPSGTIPIYNAIVYIAPEPLAPLAHGAICSGCAKSIPSNTIAVALTDVQGRFTITSTVPVGEHIPIVVQVGKWRRHIDASITACVDNPLDPSLTRLPRRAHESSPDDDMPQIAVTTGGDDGVECFLRTIGIDDSEFTSPTGGGHVHLYQGAGGSTLSGGTATAASFWSDNGAPGTQPMASYDLVVLGCEGSTFASEKPAAALQAMEEYADLGGRVLAMHDQYYWLESNVPPSAWPSTAVWNHAQDPSNQIALPMLVNKTFPRAYAMSEWMAALDASVEGGTFPFVEARHDVDGVSLKLAAPWLQTDPTNPSPSDPKLIEAFMFFAPLTDAGSTSKACGSVVYWDGHATGSTPGGTFPNNCTQTGPLTPTQLALTFMLFNLSSCL